MCTVTLSGTALESRVQTEREVGSHMLISGQCAYDVETKVGRVGSIEYLGSKVE